VAKGVAGLGAHRGFAGGAGLAGDGPAVAQSMAAASNVCRGNGDGGGDSRHGGSIPWPGRKSTGWRTFSARWWSSGQCLAAAGGNGHGGSVDVCVGKTKREESMRERGEEGRRGERGSRGILVASSSRPGKEAGGGGAVSLASNTQVLAISTKKIVNLQKALGLWVIS
jgi:hypothetical protein